MKKKTPNMKLQWTKFIIVMVLYLLFLLWLKSWLGLVVIPFIYDCYISKKINWQWWKDAESPVRFIMSWVDALVFALVAVYFINLFFFQNYVIPSSSLEKSLLTGDYLFVSKVSYGPRIPQTPLTMPLTQHTMPALGCKSYIEWPQWDYRRAPGLGKVELNDIVVFNRYNHHRKVRFVINDVYCKRCVALPGDTISITNGLYVNNNYMGTLGVVSEQKKLSVMPDSTVDKRCLRAMPKDEHFDWTIRNFGPYYVPRKGDVMWMSPRTATMYKVLLEWELKTIVKIDWKRNLVMVGKKRLVYHRFLNDYYFMAGDNVLDSDDSRYKGPVPESYIVGIVSRIIDSKDVETQQRRWNRIGKAL